MSTSRYARDKRRIDRERIEMLERKAMVDRAASLASIANHMTALNEQLLAGLRASRVGTPPPTKVALWLLIPVCCAV